MSPTRKVSILVILVMAGVGLTAGSALAGSQQLGNTGWIASWDSALDPVLHLTVDPGTGVITEKFANFLSFDPLPIVFQQASPDATPTLSLKIDSEFITNNTSSPWNGFQMQLLSGTVGTQAYASFDQAATGIGTAGGFSINPFTSFNYSADGRVLTLSDGTVSNVGPVNNVFQPGVASGQLVINTAPVESGAQRIFVLKEIPIPGIAIPLPAAAWTGLSGLLGLGVFGAARKIRSLIA